MKEVVVCVVTYKDLFLLLHRHEHSEIDPGKWEFVSGMLKYDTDVHEKALKQVKYETRLRGHIMFAGAPFLVTDSYGQWKIYPVHVVVNSDTVNVKDKHHTEYAWVHADEIPQYDTVAGLAQNLLALNLPD